MIRTQAGLLSPAMLSNVDQFLENHMKKSGHFVSARLQTAMALLERLREHPSLDLRDHLTRAAVSLKSHETYGQRVHGRMNLEPVNKNHGRRSSNLHEWGQALLDAAGESHFQELGREARDRLINAAQERLAEPLRRFLGQEPLVAGLHGRTAEAVVSDLLLRAAERGKSGDVAQYLVGAKLALRFGEKFAVHRANQGDRKCRSDPAPRLGDFEIEDAVIEVAVGAPDPKHIDQIGKFLEGSDKGCWLLTRPDHTPAWKRDLQEALKEDMKRVVVTSVEAFVGQNITEMGEFSAKGKATKLEALFDLYNARWVESVGTPGIRIIIK